MRIYLFSSSVSDDSKRLHGAVERYPAAMPVKIPALVFGLPALFLPASLVLQNQGLQIF